MNEEPVAERAEERKMRGVVVNVTKMASYAHFQPPQLSERSDYFDYKACLDGCRYIPVHRANLAPLSTVGDILIRLRTAGFGIHIEEQLGAALEVRTAQQKFDLDALSDRIDRFDQDEEFFKRTKSRLFAYQKPGAKWLARRSSGLLADEQGLGKTAQVITAIPANARVVVCAMAVGKGVWFNETKLWRPAMRVRMLRGRGSFVWPEPNEMVILNYDILPSIHKKGCDGFLAPEKCTGCIEETVIRGGNIVTLRTKDHLPTCKGIKMRPVQRGNSVAFDRHGKIKMEVVRRVCPGCDPFLSNVPEGVVLVADEAQCLKNEETLRARAWRVLRTGVLANGGRVWLATGTPLENNPGELWAVLDAADLAVPAFGDRESFQKLFKMRPGVYGPEWGLPEDEVVERLQRVILRRMKKDVMKDLPDKRHSFITVDVDRKALTKCSGFLDDHGGFEKINTLLEQEKFPIEKMSAARAALALAKIPAMTEFVKDFEEKKRPLLVFSMHRAPIEALKRRQGWAIITGDESSDKKTAIAKAFQAGEYKGLGLTIRAGGTSLTLHRASDVLMVDLDWNPSKNVQAEDRVHRYGQKNAVIIHVLMANHLLDERVTEIIHRKSLLIRASVDASAVAENAPLDEELQKHMAALEQEIQASASSLPRRFANTDEEQKLVDDLHRTNVIYPTKQNVHLAQEIAEAAVTAGLSDAQWAIAKRLVELAVLKVVVTGTGPVEVVEAEVIEPEITQPIRVAARMREKKDIMTKNKKPEKTSSIASKPERAMALIESMTDDERDEFFELLMENWCADCGEALEPDEDHECPADEEIDESSDDVTEDGDDDDNEDEDEDDADSEPEEAS